MLPKTGITMNNGMLWFDPEPNRPNSIAPGKRPLCNICPVVVTKDGKPWFCIGASGGRRIVPAVTQLSLMLIDRGLDVETAFHHPRIDVSGVGPIRVNRDLPDAVKKAIAARLPIVEVDQSSLAPGLCQPVVHRARPCKRRADRHERGDVAMGWRRSAVAAASRRSPRTPAVRGRRRRTCACPCWCR